MMDLNKNLPSSKVTYARIAQQAQFPKKEQAIVVDAIEGITIKEYAISMGKKIGPENIRFISKISKNRVCIFLSSQDIVDKLTQVNTSILVGEHSLIIKPLINKAKRVIISNVYPLIPHHILEEKFSELNVKPESNITFIKASINDPEFAHIMSFRRQMFLKPEDIDKLPPSIKIEQDGTPYWIYISTEKLICFACNEEGHVAKHCKNLQNTSQTNNTNNSNTPKSVNVEEIQETKEIRMDKILTADVTKQLIYETLANNTFEEPNINAFMTDSTAKKRPLSSSSSSNIESENINQTKDLPEKESTTVKITQPTTESIKPPKKKKQHTAEAEIEIQLSPIKDYFEQNQKNHCLSYDKFCQYLKETYKNKNVTELTTLYTIDFQNLIKMLRYTQANITDRFLKIRLSKLVKRLDQKTTDLSELSTTEGET